MQTVPFILLSFMNSVRAWYLLAIPMAIGASVLVNLLGPLLINRWFYKKLGLIMGLMMITSLLGSVFQPLLARLIHGAGWKNAYFLFGIFALIFMSLICLLLQDHPRITMPCSPNELETPTSPSGVNASTALKSPAFFSLLLFMIVLTAFAAFQQHLTTLGTTMGFSMHQIGSALSYSMIGSAFGSVLIGILSDKTGVVAPLLTTTFFGKLDYEKLFSSIMAGAPLSTVVLLPAYGFFFDAVGNYNLVLYFLLGALVMASFGLLLGRKNSRKLMDISLDI